MLKTGVGAEAIVVTSVFRENQATTFGGGIFNAGALTLTASAVVSNTGLGGSGGGIGSTGSLSAVNTTISGNQAHGVCGVDAEGLIHLNNVTIAGNTALVTPAGGIRFTIAVSVATGSSIENTLIAGNITAAG